MRLSIVRMYSRLKEVAASQTVYMRGFLQLAGGNMIGQVLALVCSPLLTRLYTPEQFGVLGLYMAVVGVASVVTALRYDFAITLPADRRESTAVVKLSILMVVLFTFVFSCVVYRWGGGFFRNERAGGSFEIEYFLVIVSVFLVGLFNILRYVNLRENQFAIIGKSRILQVVSSLVAQVFLFPLGALGLVLGQLANQLTGVVVLLRRGEGIRSTCEISGKELLEVAYRYRRFPLVSTWASLLNRISVQLPAFFLAYGFGAYSVGMYVLVNRVLKAPSGMIVGSLNSVFISRASKAGDDGELLGIVRKLHGVLAGCCLPFLVLFAVVAPDTFSMLFGENWREAGYFARWMVIPIYYSLTVSPIASVFSIIEKQGADLAFQINLITMRGIALLVGVYFYDAITSVAIYCIASAIHYLLLLCYIDVILGGRGYSLLRQDLVSMFISVLIAMPTVIAISDVGVNWYLRFFMISLSLVCSFVLVFSSYKKLK